MAQDLQDVLRQRYGFDAWTAPRAGERLFVWHLALGGREIPGYRPIRMITPPSPRGVAAIASVWQPVTAEAGAGAILVDVFECPSRVGAADALLAILAAVESGAMERLAERAPGELAFGYGEGAVAYIRGNLTVRLLAAATDAHGVVEPARALDASLRGRPDVSKTLIAPEFIRLSVAAGRAEGGPLAIDIEVRDPRGRPVTLKFFTDTGEVVLLDGRPHFVPDAAGRHHIGAYALTGDGDASSRDLEFETR